MKFTKFFSLAFAAFLCAFIVYSIVTVKAEDEMSALAPISGQLFTYSGCGSVTLDGADYFVQDRTTGMILCQSVTSGGGLFSCSSEVGHLIYIQFGYQGKIGCTMFTQVKSGTEGLKICMMNSTQCIPDK